MANIFSQVAMNKPRYSRFDLSHDVKFSFKMGQLVPVTCMEVLPGDRFRINLENMLRFAPLLSPVMHRVNVTAHAFFVPNRILWPEWEDWITGNSEADPPYMNMTNFDVGSLADYLGYPTGSATEIPVSPLPIAAYVKIYNEFYRDQNLVSEATTDTVTDGDNTLAFNLQANFPPFSRAWQRDYFTSCLPWPQKGDSAILPLGTFEDVNVLLNIQGTPNAGMLIRDANGDVLNSSYTPTPTENPASSGAGRLQYDVSTGQFGAQINNPNPADAVGAYLDPNANMVAQTSALTAQAADIISVRRAFKLQQFLELDARGGTRYIESLKVHFNVNSSDRRLQRPEYIGGSFGRMVISEVLSTATTETNEGADLTPTGYMAGHGLSVQGSRPFSYKAEEHGWIMVLLNVQPTTAYQQGIHRSLTRFDRFDYPWPTFAHIGEQAVLVKELYSEAVDPDATFGYIPRYAECKYMNSRVAGEMRTTLDFWHLGRIFDSEPALNAEFVIANPDTRIFAVETGDTIWAHSFVNASVVRALPKFEVPRL